MKNNIWNIIGFVAGAVSIVIGLSFLLGTSATYIGDYYTFGADFYTEMYNVTKNVGHAINNMHTDIMSAFGWFFILGGLVDICIFGNKLNFPNKKNSNAENPQSNITTTEDWEE